MEEDDLAGVGTSTTRSARGISIDALSERVHTQGDQITNLAADTKQQISGLRIEVGEKFSEVKSLVGSLGNEFRTAASDSANRGRTNWIGLIGTGVSAIAVSAGIIAGLLALRLAPVEDKLLISQTQQTQISAALEKVSDNVSKNYLTRAELDTRRDDAKERRMMDEQAIKDIVATMKSDYVTQKDLANESATAIVRSVANRDHIDRVDSRLTADEKELVGRREHEQRWVEFQKQLDTNAAQERRDTDALSKKFEDLYPAATFLKDMNERQAKLEQKMIELEISKVR